MSRGLRNRNPGNIRLTQSREPLYQGEKVPSSDPEFRQFESMEWGYRAMFVLLYTYEKRYGLRTPRSLIERWAPPSENHTEAYLRFVCERVGLRSDEQISTRDKQVMIPFVAAMSQIENGRPARREEVVRGWELFLASSEE